MSKRYKLFLGDCLEVMKQIPDNSVDAIICDLPYGFQSAFLSWNKIIPLRPLWKEYKKLRKENTPILLFGNEPFSSYLRLSNIKEYKYDIKWKKEKPTNVFTIKKQPGRIYEDIVIFYKKQPFYNPLMKERGNVTNPCPMKGDLNIDETNNITGCYRHSKNYNPNLIYPTNIVEFNRDSKKGNKALHPTQKPVALMEYLIKTYTNENEIVLDNCMGSGTTGVACMNLNRKFIGIEKEEKYFNIAKERIEKAEKEYNERIKLM